MLRDNQSSRRISEIKRSRCLRGSGNCNSTPYTTISAIKYFPERKDLQLRYKEVREIGGGNFAKVFEVKTDERVIMAMKVLDQENYPQFIKELQMLQLMRHQNLVQLKYSGMTNCIFMDYMPTVLCTVIFGKKSIKKPFPKLLACCFVYQILRGLAFMHHRNIAHRDIKPPNILVDVQHGIAKICDFGSARNLDDEGYKKTYICSRWTRAIELLCNVNDYTVNVDLWSVGVCLAVMLSRKPIFDGRSTEEQITKIFTILGSPDEEESEVLGRVYPKNVATFESYFEVALTDNERAILDILLNYIPEKRAGAWENLAHEYFDQLREIDCVLPNGAPLPNLFNFSSEEMSYSRDILPRLRPKVFDLNRN